MEKSGNVECCATCRNCLAYPRNNRHNDVDYLCLVHGYYLSSIHKDWRKVERFSPGGRKLE